MLKFNKSIKIICRLFFVFLAIVKIFALPSYAENIYEYYFIPEEQHTDEDIISEYDKFIEALPDEIKEQFPDDLFSSEENIVNKSGEFINFNYLWNSIISNIVDLIFPSLKSMLIIIGVIILAAVFRQFKNSTENGKTNKLTDSVVNTAIIISVLGTDLLSLESVENFKNLICNIMNGIVPVFGLVYTASGNGNTSAIQSGGILLLVTICQNLFAIVLMPAVRICLLMSIANAIFPDSGIKSVSSNLKNISIGIISVCVTLFSFVLGMQNTVAQTADTFGMKSIKFIVGNLIPIIGGPVSDSLGTVGGSLSLLKNAGGTVTIIIIVLLLLPVLCELLLNRLMLLIVKCVAGILGSEAEENLFGELCSITSMMLSFSVSMSIAFIYVLTLFTGSTLAMNA